MNSEINKLKKIWDETEKKSTLSTLIPKIKFDTLINSLMGLGPYYYYIIDFFDMSLSNVSPSIYDIHGFDPKTVTFDDILNSIHPDDIDFVAKAEAGTIEFLYKNIGKENILNYKINYSFRSRMKNGNYELLNHQAILLTVDDSGRFGKSLNIHTNIEHITSKNNNTFSLLSLKNEPSYFNIEVLPNSSNYISYTNREIEVIKCISEGFTNKKIAKTLRISEGTVKKHRNNIYIKSGCKNSVELINKSLLHGLI